MKDAIEKFVGDNDQFDNPATPDLERKGYENSNVVSYECEADVSNLGLMLDPIIDRLRELNTDKKTVYQINLALEELFANVANYAYYPDKGMIHISFGIKEDTKELTVIIKDEGKPFNPLESEEPDITAPLQERKIGGLGLFIVKNTMDSLEYVRESNSNVLTIKKKF